MTQTSTLGTSLASAREKAGLSLQNVSDRLRIKVPYLEAIEADRYENIPQTPVFIRSYIRTYARLLGIEESVIVGLLNNHSLLNQKPPIENLKNPEPKRAKRYYRIATYVIVALLILGVLVFWVSRTDNRPTLMPQAPVATQPPVATTESPVEPSPEAASPAPATPIAPAPLAPAKAPDNTESQFTMDYS